MLAFTTLISFVLVAGVTAQECSSDVDCPANWDCMGGGPFGLGKKRCFALSCAKGAAQAFLETGFDADEFIGTIRSATGLKNRDFMGFNADNDKNSLLSEAFASNQPNLDVFTANFTACANPPTNVRRGRELQTGLFSLTMTGIQWSGAAAIAYFGKSTWGSSGGVGLQLVSNCLGALIGADVGFDYLIQIVQGTDSTLVDTLSDTSSDTKQNTVNPGNSWMLPFVTAIPLGFQYGVLDASDGSGDYSILEISFGPSVGASVLGYTACLNQLTSSQ
ncbi:unknown protein [Seminavis robusta]|uniref:Uncharacterized protein n=1 Tax=Seminavis robusta TaxID=568900 RepID=A0A9N8DVZ5_9STRA|nr:unknown protein [Seminavis robusta]|eukprot:Sro398_g134630.1 n/a (276) ;mRNA; f:18154-19194